MAASIVITVKTELTQAEAQQRYQVETGKPRIAALELERLFKNAATGIQPLSVDVQTGDAAPVAASGTITCASVAADDTVTIAGVTLTAKASPASESEWDQSGTNTADGASLASKINAHSVLSKIVSAAAASGVVTVTVLQKGVIGNYITLVSSDGTRLAVTGSGYFASGTGGAKEAAVNYNLGIT